MCNNIRNEQIYLQQVNEDIIILIDISDEKYTVGNKTIATID